MERLILAVYSVLLAAVLVLGAPWWLARMATSGRYRAGLTGRLGVIPKGLSEAVAGRRVVWLHAVSVGEVMAASELVRELRARLPEWVIAVSTTTETGQRLARERFAEVPVFYMPLDFMSVIRHYLSVLHPRLIILMESELWPNLMDACARQGIPVAVVNARVSDRSLPRYLKLRRLWRPLLERVSLFLAQSEENARRLVSIGAPAERVRVSGNLKYDVKATAGESAMTKLLGKRLPSGAKVLVAGSTLEGEERMLLDAWSRVRESVPEAVMVLAPRRPERFAAVAGLVRERGIAVVRASELRDGEGTVSGGGVVLLDTIGDLASVYSLGTAAFVGGSLVAAGGHNPLEPARFGVSVVMGESSENFREIVEAMREADGIRIVQPSGLAEALVAILKGDDAEGVGSRGRKVFDAQAGATARTVEALLSLMEEARA